MVLCQHPSCIHAMQQPASCQLALDGDGHGRDPLSHAGMQQQASCSRPRMYAWKLRVEGRAASGLFCSQSSLHSLRQRRQLASQVPTQPICDLSKLMCHGVAGFCRMLPPSWSL